MRRLASSPVYLALGSNLGDRAALLAGAVERLRALPGVTSVDVVDRRLLVGLEDPERDNPRLIRALVEAGADIQFVGELRRTLEDVCMRLVGKQDEATSS